MKIPFEGLKDPFTGAYLNYMIFYFNIQTNLSLLGFASKNGYYKLSFLGKVKFLGDMALSERMNFFAFLK